ncbi:MAG: hypothetical protein CM15mV69_590 [Caudoviricetes sp.]|nr:MAG: hypothetical protein CM15mV69_590 [Caudoviricetes sp.]
MPGKGKKKYTKKQMKIARVAGDQEIGLQQLTLENLR